MPQAAPIAPESRRVAELQANVFSRFGESGISRRAVISPGSTARGYRALVLPFSRRQPRPDVGGQLLHRSRQLLATLSRIKELIGDAERREDGGLLGLDDVAGAHRLPDHVVDVLGDGAGTLGADVAADRVLVAEDGHAHHILLGAQRVGAPSCCCLRNRTRSIICWVRARAVSRRDVRPAFSRSRNCTRSGETTPFTPVVSKPLSRASACRARRRKEASSSPRCLTSCSSSPNAALSGRTLSDTKLPRECLHDLLCPSLHFLVL